MPIALPAEVLFSKVVGRFILAVADATDVDRLPDAQPAVGTITFTPLAANLTTTSPTPATVVRQPIVCSLDANGYLVDPQLALGVFLVQGDYRVEYALGYAVVPAHDISVTSAHTDIAPLDLTGALPPGGPILSASEYAALSARIDALVLAAAPDATTTTKGIVQLAGDLAGTALAPTVPGLAGKADTGHTHAATPDATTTSTGVVQLAGDLAGTALAPTVPGLAGKAASVHTHDAADVASGVVAPARLGTGAPAVTAYLRGDGAWTDPAEVIRDTMGTALVAGANVTITVNDVGDTITVAASASSSRVPPPTIVRRGTGSWIRPWQGDTATMTFDVNKVIYAPFPIVTPDGAGVTVNGIALNVTIAGAAGSLVQFGLYASGADGNPAAQIFTSGSVATDTVGQKTVAVTSTALADGLYWIAATQNTGGGTFSRLPTAAITHYPHEYDLFRTSSFPSHAGTTLPATAGSVLSSNNINIPMVILRSV